MACQATDLKRDLHERILDLIMVMTFPIMLYDGAAENGTASCDSQWLSQKLRSPVLTKLLELAEGQTIYGTCAGKITPRKPATGFDMVNEIS